MVRFLDMDETPDAGIATEELERLVTIFDIEEGFCWDHGYHLGPRCPRCRSHNGDA